jgi:ParB family chromosome partitioning protein
VLEAVGRHLPEAFTVAEVRHRAGTPGSLEELAVDAIHERRWRPEVDVSDPLYGALVRSIAEVGVIRPLLVRVRQPRDEHLELVRGARRLRAARDLGLATVPAVVRELTELEALVGGAWQPLMRSGCTQREAAMLRDQLITAGMPAPEAAAMTAILGFRPSSEPATPVMLSGRPAWAWSRADRG